MKAFHIAYLLFLLYSLTVFPQSEVEVELNTGTGVLKGTLAVPEGEGTFPLVLMIAGSGPTDRDGNNPMMTNNSLRLLAKGLQVRGIASLRYDKRGIAASTSAGEKEEELRFENYVEDAVKWILQLREDDRFSQVIILGHSEGSLIGMMAAARTKADKFISVSGVGRPAGDILREQLSSQPPLVTAMTDPIIDTLEMGRTVDSVNPMLNSLFRASVQPYLISWFKYDPAKEIAKLDCPVLILQGTTDIQVMVQDAEMLASAYPEGEKVILEGMNHILKDAPADRMANLQTYSDPDLPLKEGLVEGIAAFIHKH